MGKKASILFVCGAGLGSSFAAQMATEDVLKELSLSASCDHVDISTAASLSPDIIITAANFQKQFEKFNIDAQKTSIVYLKNIVSKAEIREKLVPVLEHKGFLA